MADVYEEREANEKSCIARRAHKMWSHTAIYIYIYMLMDSARDKAA